VFEYTLLFGDKYDHFILESLIMHNLEFAADFHRYLLPKISNFQQAI
jgi:hypothetical protein